MSWNKAEGRLMAAKIDTVRMSVREIASHRRSRGTRNTLIFYIGCRIGEKLGWSRSARVNLYWGEGAHKGWCRIVLAADGRFAVRQTHKGGVQELSSFYFKTHQHPLDGGCVHSADVCHHVIGPDGALEIKMPQWFWKKYEKKRPDTNIGRPKKSGDTDAAYLLEQVAAE